MLFSILLIRKYAKKKTEIEQLNEKIIAEKRVNNDFQRKINDKDTQIADLFLDIETKGKKMYFVE